MAKIDINAIRREQIIGATREILAERGWDETSISEITKRADVSRGLVSYHFRDKDDILVSLLDREGQNFQNRIAEVYDEYTTYAGRLRAMLHLALEMVAEDPASYHVYLNYWAQGPYKPEIGEKIRAQWAYFRYQAARGIKAGIQAGEFREVDSRSAATMILGAILGFAAQALLDPEGFDFDRTTLMTEDVIMSYLTGQPAGA